MNTKKHIKTVQNNYNFNVSLLRIISTLAVILLHTASTISDNRLIFDIKEEQYHILNTIALLGRFAVPCFFMLTGKLLLTKEREINYQIVFGKYIKRIILALAIFGIPFAFIEQFFSYKTISLQMVFNSIICTLESKSWAHLWYLYSLFGLYLVLPLIKNLMNKPKDYVILLTILLTTTYFYSLIQTIFSVDIGFGIPLKGFPVIYFMIGGLLNIFDFDKYKKYVVPVAWTLFVVVAVIIIFTEEILNPLFVEYNSGILTLFYSVSLFLIFMLSAENNNKKANKMYSIDRMCFTVYLIHPVFINFTYKFLNVLPTDFDVLLISVFLFFVLFTLLSFTSAFIIRLIKPLKKYVL